MLNWKVFVPTPYIKVSVSYDHIINFNHHRKAYKANVLLLLLSSLVTRWLYLQCSIDIATEQNFRYMKLADTKIWISKIRHYVGFLQIGSHIQHIKYIPLVSPRYPFNRSSDIVWKLLLMISTISVKFKKWNNAASTETNIQMQWCYI